MTYYFNDKIEADAGSDGSEAIDQAMIFREICLGCGEVGLPNEI